MKWCDKYVSVVGYMIKHHVHDNKYFPLHMKNLINHMNGNHKDCDISENGYCSPER